MADLTAKQMNFVTRAIEASEAFIAASDGLSDIRQEWIDLGYGGLSWAEVFKGDIQHIALPDLQAFAGVVTTVENFMDGGGRADLLKLRK